MGFPLSVLTARQLAAGAVFLFCAIIMPYLAGLGIEKNQQIRFTFKRFSSFE